MNLDVFHELCEIVEEPIELDQKDKKTLPNPTSGRDFVDNIDEWISGISFEDSAVVIPPMSKTIRQ